MLKKTGQLILIALFLVALAAPLIKLLVSPAMAVSETEKRRLAPLPALSRQYDDLIAFPNKFENYFNDHFGFREVLISWYHRLRVNVLAISGNKRVLVGKQGWLFQSGGPHLRDMRNMWPFGPGALTHWANVLSEKHNRLAQMGIRYIFVIAPSKHTVYGDYLPPSIKLVSERSRVDQLVEHLRANTDVEVVDLRPALREARRELPTHHQTDTHWNAWGAYVGYREIMKPIKHWFRKTRIIKLDTDDFVVQTQPGGDLAVALNMGDTLTENAPVLTKPLQLRARHVTLGKDRSLRVLNQQSFSTVTDSKSPRALMFRDSYSLAMMEYLSESFSYIHYVPKSPAARSYLMDLVKEHRPDVVIEERASRWLRTPEG